MSDRGSFSIWKDDPALDSWYNAAVNRKFSLRNDDGNPMEEISFFDSAESNQVNYPSGAANEWFYGAAMGDNAIKKKPAHSPTLNALVLTLHGPESINLIIDKPLPSVPDSSTHFAPKGNVTPYFEYIFANAGGAGQAGHGKHSPDNVSFEVDNDVIEHEISTDNGADQIGDTPSPEHFMPGTPEYDHDAFSFHGVEDAGFATHAFLQAGIPITNLADNYRATIAVNSKPNFLINEADEAEKAAASAGFYGGFTVEEPPSPYHAPVTDQTSGFGDIRDGAEAFPQQWQDNERRPRACTLAEADAMVEDHPMDATSISTRPILMPIPRKTAAVRSQHNRVYSPMVIGHTSEDSSEMESNTSGRNNSSSHRHGIDDHEGKKRKVHDQSFFDTNSSDGEEVQYLYTKKARLISNDSKDAELKSARRPSTYSPVTISNQDLEHMSTKSETASAISAQIQPAPVGYPGQFPGMMILGQAMRDHGGSGTSPADKQIMTTGDCLHPNYLFTHLNFHPCLHEDKLDYRTRIARPGTHIAWSIDYADELTDMATDAPRTAAEEVLRREAYRECSLARLEGVSVGQYRYYEGHLNIEEYKEAGMCICWEACECSKMCTRFGDILCPCSKYIEIHKQ